MAGNVVSIKITADDQASAKLRDVENQSRSLTDRLRDMRPALLATTAALTGIGVASIKFASDLNEARNAATQTFGEASGAVEDFAENTASSFAISKRAAFEYTATLGGIGIASGLAKKDAADMSIEVVKLAADLASFRNLGVEDALLKIQAGLVGEIEPLRRVGVLLSAAAVETKALELGLGGANRELTEGEKVQARYALIMESLTEQGVVGDAIRTADEFAGQMRNLKQELEDAAAALGESLLPAAAASVGTLANLAETFGKLSPGLLRVVGLAGAMTAGLAALGLAIPLIITGVGALTTAVTGLGVALTAMTGPAGILILAVGAIVAGFTAIQIAADNAAAAAEEWRDRTTAALADAENETRRAFLSMLGVEADFSEETLALREATYDAILQARRDLAQEERRLREQSMTLEEELAETFEKVEEAKRQSVIRTAAQILQSRGQTVEALKNLTFEELEAWVEAEQEKMERAREFTAEKISLRMKEAEAAALAEKRRFDDSQFQRLVREALGLPEVISTGNTGAGAGALSGLEGTGEIRGYNPETGQFDIILGPNDPRNPFSGIISGGLPVLPGTGNPGDQPNVGGEGEDVGTQNIKGGVVVINHYGDNYGIDDLESMVAGANNRARDRGASVGDT